MADFSNMVISRRSIAALLVSLPWLAKPVIAGQVPSPVTKTDFDVSRKDIVATIDFRIRRARSYVFALQFTYDGQEDELRVLQMVGFGPRRGTPINVGFKLYRLADGDQAGQPIVADIFSTEGSYAHGFSEERFHGKFSRGLSR